MSTKKKPIAVKTTVINKVSTKRNVEQQNRVEALNKAVEIRMSSSTTDDVLLSARKYFDFLQGVEAAPAANTASAES